MHVLDKAKDWAMNNLIDEDSLAILLVGSWARGKETDPNDIDLIIIKQFQLVGIIHQEHVQNDFSLDVWIHDKDAMKSELFEPAVDLNQVNNISLILSSLADAVIWYEKEPFLNKFIERVNKWTWDPNYEKYLIFDSKPPATSWAKKAYEENLRVLEAAKKRLIANKPVGHRQKDYPELINDKDELLAREAMELTITAYKSLGIERSWSEFADAKKALATGNWSNAIASLKDVLRYIVRYDLPAVPDQLLDPRIWKEIDTMPLSDVVKVAFEKVYS